MTREQWLDSNDLGRLQYIENHVRELWNKEPNDNFYKPLYDDTHCLNVEKSLYLFISDHYENLSANERFILLASSWLCYTGMTFSSRESTGISQDDQRQTMHKDYELYSERYAKAIRPKLGLNDIEITIISILCKYHRDINKIAEHEKIIVGNKVLLIASCLSLADTIHRDTQFRIVPHQFQKFLSGGLTANDCFHGLKGILIAETTIDNCKLKIIFRNPFMEGSELSNVLTGFIKETMNEKLYYVRDILIENKISYLLKIESELLSDCMPPNDQENDIKRIICNVILHSKPSASDIVNNVCTHLIHLSQNPDGLNLIRSYNQHVLIPLSQERPCHVILNKIVNFINKSVSSESSLINEDSQRLLAQIKNRLLNFQSFRESALNKLYENALPLLIGRGGILLFGFSQLVLGALSRLDTDSKKYTKIYVCSCGAKSIYNYKNEITYSDGIDYAKKLTEKGFEDVTIIPDCTIANVLSRNFINKVVIGVNGIDIDKGIFGHTAGHLTIVDLSQVYKLPVYVLADRWKFGELKFDKELKRDNSWLTSPKNTLLEIEKHHIKTHNPREDVVKFKLDSELKPETRIYLLITDIGVFPPSQISQSLQDNLKNSEI